MVVVFMDRESGDFIIMDFLDCNVKWLIKISKLIEFQSNNS